MAISISGIILTWNNQVTLKHSQERIKQTILVRHVVQFQVSCNRLIKKQIKL